MGAVMRRRLMLMRFEEGKWVSFDGRCVWLAWGDWWMGEVEFRLSMDVKHYRNDETASFMTGVGELFGCEILVS